MARGRKPSRNCVLNSRARRVRTGRPSGGRALRTLGVECYCILPDGSEWGWQAKYFHTLGPSQWQQLDSSVKTAIKKHPSLVRYFVCVPYDRPDARISGQKSAMERWDGHVEKWKSWAQERKMNVEFVWWGSSELWNLLSGSEHIGRLYFWFGKRRFDEAWFQARFNEARDTAGPRYTPEIHVDLPIAHDLATFGRSESLFHKISSFARRIRRELGYVTGPNSSEEEVRLDDLPQAGHALVKGLSAVKPMPIGTLPFSSITDAVRKVEKKAAEIEKTLSEKIYSSSAQSAEDENRAAYQRRIHPFVQQRERIHRLQSELRQAYDILSNADKIASSWVVRCFEIGWAG